ncbi:pantoate--beta-alanine ligase [Foetidibacter luteolus]|uniref:pantoate--beta-alanine ligase n=1 Tax=Foetidibacter luteolus TaxID=2608880 RepID=UPI00129A301F|nr:pantoate--beta-alanine ligase [Foetidibacter luteolus]
MIVFKTCQQLLNYLEKAKAAGRKTGFVPTMGALHAGHTSLIRLSKAQADITICSIFVNPTQFNDPRDYEKYPVTIEKDILLLETEGTDILFLPSVQEMYPSGLQNGEHYNLGHLENILEGTYRPGHFQGVCRIMDRLLSIVQPHLLFLGQKDYQQCMVIKKLAQLKNFSTQIVIAPTLREKSGLAMSSRNMRLSDEAKEKATAIYEALKYIKENIGLMPVATLEQQAKNKIMQAGFEKVDYITICHANNLQPVEEWQPHAEMVAVCAAFIDGVRLIDNLLLQ